VLVHGVPSSAVILIGGQVVTTNDEGQFAFANVGPTYDATVELTSGAIVYQGMTSRSPVFNVSPQSGTGAALVPMKLPAAPDPTHRVTVFATTGDPGLAPFAFAAGANASAFSALPTLAVGPLGASVVLHALAFDTDSVTQEPTAWTGHAEIALADLQWTEPSWSVQFAPVTSASVGIRPSLPAGYGLGAVSMFAHGGDAALSSTPTRSSGGALVFSAPDIAGVTFDVLALASSATGEGGTSAIGLAPGENASVSFPGAPSSLAPEDGAFVEPGASFAFAPVPGLAHWVTFAPTATTGYTIQIVTTASSVTVPDLGALGHPLAEGASFTWWVECNGTPPTVDAAAAAGLVVNGGVGPLQGVSSFGQSSKRLVTFGSPD
jgi:hypothetical protein